MILQRTVSAPIFLMIALLGVGPSTAAHSEIATIDLRPGVHREDWSFVFEIFKNLLVDFKVEFDEERGVINTNFPSSAFHKIEIERDVLSRYIDLNGDKKVELILNFQHVAYCGTAGCSTFVFEKQDREWIRIGEFSAFRKITMLNKSHKGWRIFKSEVSCVFWHDNGYKGYLGQSLNNTKPGDPDCN